MPKGQAPYPKKPEKDFGEKLRDNLSKLRGPTEKIGKKIQETFPAISKKFPDKKAKGGMVRKAQGRKR
jgi:hypothetical protein